MSLRGNGQPISIPNDELREIFSSIQKGNSVASVAASLFPILHTLKERCFQEFAYSAADPLALAKMAGKAELCDQLIKTCEMYLEEGKEAQNSLGKERN